MKKLLATTFFISLIMGGAASAGVNFNMKFKNDTSIPFTFSYKKSASVCWYQKHFTSKVTVAAGKTSESVTTQNKASGTCALDMTSHYKLGLTVNAGGKDNTCIFSYKVQWSNVWLSGSCIVKDPSGNKYTVSVSGHSSSQLFTVKKK